MEHASIDLFNVHCNSSSSDVKFCLVQSHKGQFAGHVEFVRVSISVIEKDCNCLLGIILVA